MAFYAHIDQSRQDARPHFPLALLVRFFAEGTARKMAFDCIVSFPDPSLSVWGLGTKLTAKKTYGTGSIIQ